MKLIDADLTGRVALVTGANSGMGKETPLSQPPGCPAPTI